MGMIWYHNLKSKLNMVINMDTQKSSLSLASVPNVGGIIGYRIHVVQSITKVF